MKRNVTSTPPESAERPKVKRIGGCYWNQSDGYVRKPMWGLSRTLKADGGHPAGILIEYI